MMMDYNSMYQGMMGGSTGFAMIFMWLTYLIVLIDLILAGVALWKYINKK
jgi:uncharacterized membrane protein